MQFYVLITRDVVFRKYHMSCHTYIQSTFFPSKIYLSFVTSTTIYIDDDNVDLNMSV